VRDRRGRCVTTAIDDGVPDGPAIVDFVLEPWAHERLARLVGERGRALVAGTPALYAEGFTHACEPLLAALGAPGVEALLVGGDTVAELPWEHATSTGGGATLHYLASGSCPVVDALTRTLIPREPCASTT